MVAWLPSELTSQGQLSHGFQEKLIRSRGVRLVVGKTSPIKLVAPDCLFPTVCSRQCLTLV